MRAVDSSEELGLIMLKRRDAEGWPEEWQYRHISTARKFPQRIVGTVFGLKPLLLLLSH